MTLKNILEQDYQKYEIIVVDSSEDASSKDIIANINDQRIRYILSPKKPNFRDVSHARNEGIKASNGELIAFIDDDDRWDRTKLNKQVGLMISSPDDIGLIYCGCKRVSCIDGHLISVDIPKFRGDASQNIMQRGFIMTVCVLVKKKYLSIAGPFDESLEMAEDWDMWVRLGKVSKFDYIVEPLATYNIRSYTPDDYYTDLKALKAWEVVFYKHIAEMNNETLGYNYHRRAVSYLKLGMKKEAKESSMKALALEFKWNYLAVRLMIPLGPKFFKTAAKITGR